jgi:hypothetical protein
VGENGKGSGRGTGRRGGAGKQRGGKGSSLRAVEAGDAAQREEAQSGLSKGRRSSGMRAGEWGVLGLGQGGAGCR